MKLVQRDTGKSKCKHVDRRRDLALHLNMVWNKLISSSTIKVKSTVSGLLGILYRMRANRVPEGSVRVSALT